MTPLSDDYDDDILDSNSKSNDKTVRKRSSKACDNCRKAKCKCERTNVDGEPCRNCVLLGAECTFLGPSRKRGPPKGYIDAIESKLHQMEALLGTIITSSDPRARSLIADLAGDPLAQVIIQRVEDSPFGTRGRKQAAASREAYGPGGIGITSSSRRQTAAGLSGSNSNKLGPSSTSEPSRFGFTQPPHEWQDQLTERIRSSVYTKRSSSTGLPPPEIPPPFAAYSQALQQQTHSASSQSEDIKPSLASFYSFDTSSNGHQRRRVERRDSASQSPPGWSPTRDGRLCETPPPLNLIDAPSTLSILTGQPSPPSKRIFRQQPSTRSLRAHYQTVKGHDSEDSDADSDSSEVVDSMGQLSINEHHVVRYHGKASGLHLLMAAMATESESPSKPSTPPAPSPWSRSNIDVNYSRAGSTSSTSAPTTRVNGGIWQFAAARVWPPVEGSEESPVASVPTGLSNASSSTRGAGLVGHDGTFTTYVPSSRPTSSSASSQTQASTPCATLNSKNSGRGPEIDRDLDARASIFLPDLRMQEKLLNIYFTYVHPYLPVLCKKADFMGYWRLRKEDSPEGQAALSHTPNVLLLSIFAIASRYSNESPPPAEGTMWSAGDDYYDRAREIIVQSIGISKLEMIQSMLLLGYREIGVGGMSAAWLLVGVAIRLAQDLGLHRSIAKWQSAGSSLFTATEKQTRSRVWFCCVRMDKYVSTYIGRPQSIYERDYDTKLPDLDDDEEKDLWDNHPSLGLGSQPLNEATQTKTYHPLPGRAISCFNASAALSSILSAIMLNLYSTRLPSSSVRYRERAALEEKLEKWYIDLPEHLKFDVYAHSGSIQQQQSRSRTSSAHVLPPPHVLTLHMQYWCTVLLLHRPFIRPKDKHPSSPSSGSGSGIDVDEANAIAAKAYGICASSAQHITTIAATYQAAFSMVRAPAIFSYYIFTASIMQVTSLMDNPSDIQATLGLSTTMKILKDMSIVWPSAGRAWDLLDGTRVDIREVDLNRLRQGGDRKKRLADELGLDGADDEARMSEYSVQHQPAANQHQQYLQHHRLPYNLGVPSVSHVFRSQSVSVPSPGQLHGSAKSHQQPQQLSLQTGGLLGSQPYNLHGPRPRYSQSIVDLHFSSPLAGSMHGVIPHQQQQTPTHHVARQSSVSSIDSPFGSYDPWSQQSQGQGYDQSAMSSQQQPGQVSTSSQRASLSQSQLPPLTHPHASLPPPLPPIQHPNAHNPPELPYVFNATPSSVTAALSENNYRAGSIGGDTHGASSTHAGSPHTPAYQEPFGSSDLPPPPSTSVLSRLSPSGGQPLVHDPHSRLSTGYWNEYRGADPLGDPSLLAYATPMLGGGGSAPTGYDCEPQPQRGIGSHHHPSPPLQQQQRHQIDRQYSQPHLGSHTVYPDGRHLDHQSAAILAGYTDGRLPPSAGPAQPFYGAGSS